MFVLWDVSKQYRPDDPPALAGVSLTIAEGEFVALLGPSGAGKSTLIRMLCGLVRPDSGEVRFRGAPIQTMAEPQLRAVRRELAVIFQEYNLLERHSALANAMMGRLGRYPLWRAALGLFAPADAERAQQALQRVGLEHLAGAPVRELSGGQRQRVAAARALVQEPRAILGDEPVSNLDEVAARSVLELLRDLNRREGLTLVLSLHQAGLAREFAGRVIGLDAGRVRFDGPASDLDGAALAQIYGRPASGRRIRSGA